MTTSPNRIMACTFGAVFLALGILGFTVTDGVDFFATDGGTLFGAFGVNPLLNTVHILFGAALLLAGLSHIHASRRVNAVVGALLVILGVASLFIIDTTANVFAMNEWDTVLHFGSAILLLAAGVGAERPSGLNTGHGNSL